MIGLRYGSSGDVTRAIRWTDSGQVLCQLTAERTSVCLSLSWCCVVIVSPYPHSLQYLIAELHTFVGPDDGFLSNALQHFDYLALHWYEHYNDCNACQAAQSQCEQQQRHCDEDLYETCQQCESPSECAVNLARIGRHEVHYLPSTALLPRLGRQTKGFAIYRSHQNVATLNANHHLTNTHTHKGSSCEYATSGGCVERSCQGW